MKTDPAAAERPRRATWALTLAKLAVIALFIILANVAVSRLIGTLEIQIWPQHLEIVDGAVLLGVILYIALMATPFLPGIELGLALMRPQVHEAERKRTRNHSPNRPATASRRPSAR